MRNSPHELMLFAAGFGSRMQPLTADLPKPLISVAGQSLLDRTLELAQAGGISKIVVNTHYLGHKIRDHLKDKPVNVVHETKILDTGGGLKNARSHFEGPVIFTSNGDAIWSGPNPFEVLAQHWQDDCEALLLCAPVDQVQGRATPGDFSVAGCGTVTRGGDWVYLGVQIIKLDAVESIATEAFSLNLVWDQLIARDTLRVAAYTGQWCDIGRPENIALGAEILDRPHV